MQKLKEAIGNQGAVRNVRLLRSQSAPTLLRSEIAGRNWSRSVAPLRKNRQRPRPSLRRLLGKTPDGRGMERLDLRGALMLLLRVWTSKMRNGMVPGFAAVEDLVPVDADFQALRDERSLREVLEDPMEECVLGEGTYGVVWRAKDPVVGKCYAVKLCEEGRAQEGLRERERQIARRAWRKPHPFLIQFFDVCTSPRTGSYHLVMELCTGGTLQSRIAAARQEADANHVPYSPPRKASIWIAQIFLALEHMHKVWTTLFRDLKPENVVLSAPRDVVKLVDFGFGRPGVQSHGEYSFGMPSGTPGYAAPEILLKEPYDARCDLYSLGVLAWVLLTGGVKSLNGFNVAFPSPPIMGGGRTPGTHDLLECCISEPARHHAQGLAGPFRDLVVQLTQRSLERRMQHEDVRKHPFMVPLELPAPRASHDVLEKWVRHWNRQLFLNGTG